MAHQQMLHKRAGATDYFPLNPLCFAASILLWIKNRVKKRKRMSELDPLKRAVFGVCYPTMLACVCWQMEALWCFVDLLDMIALHSVFGLIRKHRSRGHGHSPRQHRSIAFALCSQLQPQTWTTKHWHERPEVSTWSGSRSANVAKQLMRCIEGI